MAKEGIDRIRAAEMQAEQDEKEAHQQAEELLAHAKNDAVDRHKAAVAAAKEAAIRTIAERRAENERRNDALAGTTEQELEQLKKTAAAREQQAIDAVLKELAQ